MKITFTVYEYKAHADGSIEIPLQTVIGKLPKPEQVRFAPVQQKEEADRLFQQLVTSGVLADELKSYLNLNFRQTKRHTRSAGVYLRLLSNLESLREKYGAAALNAAILKSTVYEDPQKCRISYLIAILKNLGGEKMDSRLRGNDNELISGHLCHSREGGNPSSPLPLWEQVKANLKQYLSRGSYYTWIEPTHQISHLPAGRHGTDERLVVGVPEELFVFQLSKWQSIPAILKDFGWQGELEFVVEPGEKLDQQS